MNNAWFGIPLVILCAAGYFASWKLHEKGAARAALWLLLACGLALRVFASLDFFLHDWDEQFHALVAKHLAAHPLLPTLYEHPLLPYDFRSWSSNHVWLHKPPLPLWGMAASMRLLGVNEFALRLPSILLSTGGIALTFFLASKLTGPRTAYLAAFFHSINGQVIEVTSGRTGRDHIDAFFIFFVELAIVLSLLAAGSKRLRFSLLVGVSTGCAVLSKWLPGLIVLPVWLLLVLRSGTWRVREIVVHAAALATALIVVALPWQVYTHRMFPVEAAWEASFNSRHMTEALEGHGGSAFFYVEKIARNYGELVWIPVCWFLWRTAREKRALGRWAIAVWFVVPFLFFSFVTTKVQEYVFFTAPALFIMTSEFWNAMADRWRANRKEWWIPALLLLLVALPVRYSVERLRPFSTFDRRPPWTEDLRALGREHRTGVLLNYPYPIHAMFYSSLTVYPSLPDRATIQSLIGQGHRVLINDRGDLPQDVIDLPQVEIVRLRERGPRATSP